jgi:hypothetical protein
MKGKIKLVVVFIVGIVLTFGVYAILTTSSNEELNRFKAIPEKPKDFDAYTREVWSGGLTDLCEIKEAYWKQPEFYRNSWNIAKERFYTNPDYSKWGVYGQGNIPQKIGYDFTNLKVGDEFTLCTFFHNGFGIWTYQGFKLIMEENEYFDIKITPNELTTNPTFPVFEDGWTKKIQIKLKVKKEIPKGNYNFKMNVVEPTDEYARKETRRILELEINKEEYSKECLRFLKDKEKCTRLINLREKKYVNGGSYQTNQPLLDLFINVK